MNLFRKNVTKQRLALVLLLGLIVATPALAQTATGGAAIEQAANTIKGYWTPLKNLIMVIGGIVGLIGGLRIYNKWSNGDQDINKEVLGWGGACLFLILVPIFIGAFFGF